MPLQGILNLLFPARCPSCGEQSDGGFSHPLCGRCWGEIRRYTGPCCSSCGTPLPSAHSSICERCLREPPLFAGVFYYGLYEGNLREAIHLLKFKGIRRMAKPLCSLLSHISRPEAEAIVPVPLHLKGLRKRGFNQTAVMARHLSRQWKIPLFPDTLRKVKATLPQTEVTGKERMENLKGSFEASEAVTSLRIVLVDDVITTGATVRECSRTLLKAGAKEVIVVALACTPAP